MNAKKKKPQQELFWNESLALVASSPLEELQQVGAESVGGCGCAGVDGCADGIGRPVVA